MKKYVYAIAALASIVSLASCTKEPDPENFSGEIPMPEPNVVSFEACLDDSDAATKISFGDVANKKMPIFWRKGDAFRLIATKSEKFYLDTLKESVTACSLTDCGSFTTTQDSVTKAWFSGVIPADAVSSTEGIAIFPASAYIDTSANVSIGWNKAKTTTDSTKSSIGLCASIPAEQDGTGSKYVLAGARLRNGVLSGFTYATVLVKVNVPAELGINKIVLSTQDENYYGLATDKMKIYYYMTGNGKRTMSTAITNGCSTAVEVSRDGEELSGDIYFATRNLKLYTSSTATKETATSSDTARLYLRFYKGETQVSNKYTYRLTSSYSGGCILDFGEINPTFPEQTVVTYDSKDKQKFIPAYEGAGSSDEFPWKTGTKPYVFRMKTDTLVQSWYQTERKYTYDGYTWTFGSTYTPNDLSSTGTTGKYGYNTSSSYTPWIDNYAYIKLPVISGKRLIAVKVTIINKTYQVWFRISSKNTATASDPGLVPDEQIMMNNEASLVLVLPNTAKDTQYYMISTSSWQPSKIELFYQ